MYCLENQSVNLVSVDMTYTADTGRLSQAKLGTGSRYFTVKGSLCLLFCCIAGINTIAALAQ